MKLFWLLLVPVMLLAIVANAQVTVICEKEKNEKGDKVEFFRITSKNLNVYLVSPKDGILNTDVQAGLPIPFFKSLSVGIGGSGINSFADRVSFGMWGGDTLLVSKTFLLKWTIGRCTANEKGLTTRWFLPVNHRKVPELSLVPQVFYNSVPQKDVLDYGIALGVEKWGWQAMTTFWRGQGTWFLFRKTFKGRS